MKGKIDNSGSFHIERHGTMKRQSCPWSVTNQFGYSTCGDWCPHFGEPGPYEVVKGDDLGLNYSLVLSCGNTRTFKFDMFTDERQ